MASDPVSSVDGLAPIYLEEPPGVVRLGVGRHGTTGLVDRFSLPELWSLHLYSYRATLLVEDCSFQINPNDISLVPPTTRIEYRCLGPSQHLYAHLRISGAFASEPASSTEVGKRMSATSMAVITAEIIATLPPGAS